MKKSFVLVPLFVLVAACSVSGPVQAPSPAVTITGEQTDASAVTPGAPPMAPCVRDGDDVIVEPDTTCVLVSEQIEGNVTVGAGGTLVVRNSRIDGNIQGQGHASVSVTGGLVDGNIQLTNGQAAVISGVRIDGDLQAERNVGVQTFTNNTIEGNLQCQENDPAPTGGGNTTGGNKEDQCAGL